MRIRWALPFSALPVLALVLTLSSPALASVMLRLELDELTSRADVVAVAQVVAQEVLWDPAGRIVTDVQLQVEEPVKGVAASGEVLTLRCLGGAIGELGMRVEGEPSFEGGERVLLFAAQSRVGPYLRPVGMSQGVMPVLEGALGARMVHPGGAGLTLVTRGGSLDTSRNATATEPRPLPDVLADLEGLVTSERTH